LIVELLTIREEAHSSWTHLEAPRNSLVEFQECFKGFVALFEMVEEKIFLAMYFFNQLRGT
jgi:hypothetical protein